MLTPHEALLQLKAGNIPKPNYGICANLEQLTGSYAKSYAWVPEQTHDWPEFSGDLMYPVPSPTPGVSPEKAYHEAATEKTVWTGPYGEARLRLLDYLIEVSK